MATTADDITIVLSGGSVNLDPSLSLGGDPSYSPIPNGVINNLFADIPAERIGDLETYRCIYICNDGDTTIWNLETWIQQTGNDGSEMEIGILENNELQRITINNSVSGGNLVLTYKNINFIWNYNNNLAIWANNLQNLLEGLENPSDSTKIFRNVTVNAQNIVASNQIIFDINWSGKDAKRSLEQIEINANQLQPSGINVFVATSRNGSPINTIAQQLDAETTTPSNVGFFVASSSSPIVLPKLEPAECFPLWIKRYVPQQTAAKADDGFSLAIRAQSLET